MCFTCPTAPNAALFGRNRMRCIQDFPATLLSRMTCGFAVFRLFRNRFLSGVTRASTVSSGSVTVSAVVQGTTQFDSNAQSVQQALSARSGGGLAAAWAGGVQAGPARVASEFIALLLGAAATWPLAARAQQGGRMRRIGVRVERA